MTRSEAKDLLLKEFITQYGDTTPYALQNNEDFVKPTDSPWVRFIIRNNDAGIVSFGPKGQRRFGRMGSISYQVFIPINTGTYEGDILCEQINDIFEGERFGDIACKDGIWREIGVTNDEWFQFNGQIYYEFDQTK